MRSPDDGKRLSTFSAWNRKLHFYTGLYLLLFVWLFSFTGLLLNHPKWTFADFWPQRKQSSFEREIRTPVQGSDLAQAEDIAGQLGLTGEIEWTRTRADLGRLDFRVSRPGRIFEISADYERRRASVHGIEFNAWGVMRVLHSFTGVRTSTPANERDWVVTTLWAASMDLTALGLILMVLGSLEMWWRQKQKRGPGLMVLSLGVASCGAFVWGLRWMF